MRPVANNQIHGDGEFDGVGMIVWYSYHKGVNTIVGARPAVPTWFLHPPAVLAVGHALLAGH